MRFILRSGVWHWHNASGNNNANRSLSCCAARHGLVTGCLRSSSRTVRRSRLAAYCNTNQRKRRWLWSCRCQSLVGIDSKRQTLRKLPLSQLSHWQAIDTKATLHKVLAQLEYLRALSQHLPSVTFKAPKPLLTAIKRYTSGTGALEPVINHIAQRPILAQSLRQAVEQQQLPANDPHRMQLGTFICGWAAPALPSSWRRPRCNSNFCNSGCPCNNHSCND